MGGKRIASKHTRSQFNLAFHTPTRTGHLAVSHSYFLPHRCCLVVSTFAVAFVGEGESWIPSSIVRASARSLETRSRGPWFLSFPPQPARFESPLPCSFSPQQPPHNDSVLLFHEHTIDRETCHPLGHVISSNYAFAMKSNITHSSQSTGAVSGWHST
jgi:hypothetical protein